MKVSVRHKATTKRTQQDGSSVRYLRLVQTVNGKAEEESLRKYIYDPAKTTAQKKHNKDIMSFVDELVYERKRLLERSVGGLDDLRTLEKSFLEVYNSYRDLNGRDWKGSEQEKWNICEKHIMDFFPNLSVREITPTVTKQFWMYLCDLKKTNGLKISRNSARTYIKPYVQVAKDLWRQGVLSKDPLHGVKMKAESKTQAPSLTEEELQIAFNTKPRPQDQQLINAFLFSCLTGLRVGDIRGLCWGHLKKTTEGFYYLDLDMQKTGESIIVWLSDQARELMGEPQSSHHKVFPQINGSAFQYARMEYWMKMDCKIDKRITWHSGRHTFAYRYLRVHKNPVNLMYLLGHKNIETTKIYFNYKPEDSREDLINMPKL
jgi:integrase